MKYDYHVFVCANQKGEGKKCCGEEAGMEAVKHLRERIRKENSGKKIRIQRAGCLDLCAQGPALVIYPEGCFYQFRDAGDLDKIADRHLLGGKPVQELLIPEEA